MPSVSVTSLKGNKLLSWLICFGVAALATFLLYDPARPQVNMYWFGTILAIAMFATSLLPNFATVVLLLMYYIITGVASPEMAFVGWTAPIPWLSMCGMLLGVLMINVFPTLLWIGIALFAMTTLFSLITLPVEINASQRAVMWLEGSGVVDAQTKPYAVDALKWAAYTYVIAALGSLATLFYYISLANDRR